MLYWECRSIGESFYEFTDNARNEKQCYESMLNCVNGKFHILTNDEITPIMENHDEEHPDCDDKHELPPEEREVLERQSKTRAAAKIKIDAVVNGNSRGGVSIDNKEKQSSSVEFPFEFRCILQQVKMHLGKKKYEKRRHKKKGRLATKQTRTRWCKA